MLFEVQKPFPLSVIQEINVILVFPCVELLYKQMLNNREGKVIFLKESQREKPIFSLVKMLLLENFKLLSKHLPLLFTGNQPHVVYPAVREEI